MSTIKGATIDWKKKTLTCIDICTQASAPVHSKTTSKPSGSPNCFKADWMHSRVRLSCSSVVLALYGGGAVKVWEAKPLAFAKSSRDGLMSMATTRAAPRDFARAQARSPMVPTPKTRTVCPLARSARFDAWRRTERGSASAA